MSEYSNSYNKSHALITAVDDYRYLNNLNNSVRGANAISSLLSESFEFEVTQFFNEQVTSDSIFKWFFNLKCHQDDRIIFFFSGHGLQFRNTHGPNGCLATSETPKEFEDILSSNSIMLNQLIPIARDLPVKHVLIVLDACYSGQLINLRSMETTFTDKLISRRIRYAITAGGIEPVDDNASPDGTLSLFTHYLIEGLSGAAQDEQGIIRAKTLATYLEKRVGESKITVHKPNFGYFSKTGDGDFVFRAPAFRHKKASERQSKIIVYDGSLIDDSDISILQKLKKTDELRILEKITHGQSGSSVFLVDVKSKEKNGPDGLHFCKIYRTPEKQNERHEQAYKTPIRAHIPKLVDTTPFAEGWMASIYNVANQTTLRGSKSLSNLILSNMRASMSAVAALADILVKWNVDTPNRDYSLPIDLFRLPLKRYITGSDIVAEDIEAEDIATRVKKTFDGLTKNYTHILFDSSLLPNPIAFFSRYDLWRQARSISWPIGNVHGDLHSNNVLCLMTKDSNTISESPVIIDFDTYENNAPIFFDFAYLEIDLLMRMLPPESENDKKGWLSISRYLSRSVSLDTDPPLTPRYYPVHILLITLRKAVSGLCLSQPGDFEVAYWIARTAAGLSFARKRKPSTAEKKLALLISAHSLEKALEELEIEHLAYREQFKEIIWSKKDNFSLSKVIENTSLFYDKNSKQVLVFGNPTSSLTELEGRIFQCLYKKPGLIISKDDLISAGWPNAKGNVSDDDLIAAIARLRKKIEPDSKNPRFLQNVHNQGYMLQISDN